MKILVLAPHPFYQERGTPIAVDLLLRALNERGDRVDVLTFHEGEPRQYENVEVHRINPVPGIKGVPPGFSVKKLICDLYLFFRFIGLMRRGNYDVVHAVEESAFMAMLVCPWWSKPFVYDIDSCMTTQIIDRFPVLTPFRGLMTYMESLPIRRARMVVPVCDSLADMVARYRQGNTVVLKDVSLLGLEESAGDAPDVRAELGIGGKIAMYIGNLEPYQGIDLMLESFREIKQAGGETHLVVIGGVPAHVEEYRSKAKALDIRDRVHFLGQQPVNQMAGYMQQADILISPRIQGVNTPMKIYSYLHSGRAVLATRLPTHTQVMNDELAMLAAPDRHSFSASMATLLEDGALRARLAQRAVEFIEAEHSYEAFREKVHGLYARLERDA